MSCSVVVRNGVEAEHSQHCQQGTCMPISLRSRFDANHANVEDEAQPEVIPFAGAAGAQANSQENHHKVSIMFQDHQHHPQQQHRQICTSTTSRGSLQANCNELESKMFQLHDFDQLNRMRERLFRLLSKVPIKVETMKAEGKWNYDRVAANSNKAGAMAKRPPGLRNGKEHLRDPLVIEYYHDKSLTNIIELHFACSLVNQRQQQLEARQSPPYGAVAERATTMTTTTTMMTAASKAASNRNNIKSMAVKDKFKGQPSMSNYSKGRTGTTKIIGGAKWQRRAVTKCHQHHELIDPILANTINCSSQHSQQHQGVFQQIIPAAQQQLIKQSPTNGYGQFISVPSSNHHQAAFVTAYDEANRADLYQNHHHQQSGSNHILNDAPIEQAAFESADYHIQSAGVGQHHSPYHGPNHQQPLAGVSTFHQQQLSVHDQSQPSNYNTLELSQPSLSLTSYHNNNTNNNQSLQVHSKVFNHSNHSYTIVPMADSAYAPVSQEVQEQSRLYCSQVSGGDGGANQQQYQQQHCPLTLTWSSPSSSSSSGVASGTMEHSLGSHHQHRSQDLLNHHHHPIYSGDSIQIGGDVGIYSNGQQHQTSVMSTTSNSSGSGSNQYFTHFRMNDLNQMIEQQQQIDPEFHYQVATYAPSSPSRLDQYVVYENRLHGPTKSSLESASSSLSSSSSSSSSASSSSSSSSLSSASSSSSVIITSTTSQMTTALAALSSDSMQLRQMN